jgi:tetratricopeptide (TPR) repeat protein
MTVEEEGRDATLPPSGMSGLLERAVEAYSARLYQDAGAKDGALKLGPLEQLSPLETSNLLRQTARRERDLFGQFSFAKHALELCVRKNIMSDFADLLTPWLRACVEIGAFRECIRYANAVINSDIWSAAALSRLRLPILFCVAKSYRNIGRYEEAKHYYRRVIEMAEVLGETVEISIGLLLMGKLYGNYLGQRSLFSCFIEEAKRRLENELRHDRVTEVDRIRIRRCIAICHDALGQAYRDDSDSDSRVRNHFIKAINLNRDIQRRNGVSRALCHLNQVGFAKSSTPEEKLKHLQGFKEGIDLLLLTPQDEKGLGVRFIQYSKMLAEVGRTEQAWEYHAYGKLFVEKYSEYKMQAHASIVEYGLYKNSDMERAINALKQGRDVARQYNLIIQELEINRLLAEIPAHLVTGTMTELPELLESNRQNLGTLIAKVKESFSQLNSADDLQPEFKHLSEEAKKGIPEKLLLDYDHTVKQLDRNMQVLIALLKKMPFEAGRAQIE